MTADSKCMDEHEQTPTTSMEEIIRPKAPHQPFFFKFSLEWMDRPQWPTKNKRLFTPCLPVASQLHVEHRRSPDKSDYDTASENPGQSDLENDEQEPNTLITDQDTPTQPTLDTWPRTPTTKNSPLPELPSQHSYDHLVPSKYAGRALAEWAHIVSECDSFFARRRDEGVPSDRMVETPTLGVESFRK